MKILLSIFLIVILISILNYSCDSLCEDENSTHDQKEASIHKTDTLEATID
ncbi:hypothetical protein SAMN05444671_4216 [Flavobacterium sp. CF108]|uniref:hypothetical protein n=1 Tax=unclassified Flavobacterium TaxID=196869 RepID=UPI0008C5CBAF|nr:MULTISPECIES: hypothetical protein [unclassified Flavobacterium]SEO70183.1 hypothetical protein SAMN04487978_3470 [Flavobacterium sp. fv08]SHH90806.1 hypothetical protein SAMN05444671_4216 [Flavobacterium sp. CF108]